MHRLAFISGQRIELFMEMTQIRTGSNKMKLPQKNLIRFCSTELLNMRIERSPERKRESTKRDSPCGDEILSQVDGLGGAADEHGAVLGAFLAVVDLDGCSR